MELIKSTRIKHVCRGKEEGAIGSAIWDVGSTWIPQSQDGDEVSCTMPQVFVDADNEMPCRQSREI